MKIYKEYYVSVKPDSELAYVLPLTGSEKKIVEQKAKENYLVELAEKWKGSIDERAYDALISYQVSIDD